ncbi:TetR/AcrR family transcriptional regulator [Gordonia sp. TBRC 11910]|uniref:TetR/AcrR family transcriptional regulator n=1 Tax=Gordonia asplenii TaxID=2725283 RepID=A0A848L672_9ACTN|nr:TetR/AcrR family transcriptional regulator [Gordonia asplenii]NMO04495.1 TetR/AcrR family transcriptional regulator [Gordonia asplenii]
MSALETGAGRFTHGRAARVREAVLDATMTVLSDKGWAGLTIPEVAAQAGVHDTTVYRRWGTRERLVVDALLDAADVQLPIPDTGSLHDDLVGFVTELITLTTTPLGIALAHALSAPADDPAIVDACSRYFRTRFETASAIIDRAIARGDVPPTADGTLAIEMLTAPIHFRTLISHHPLDDTFPQRLTNMIIAGLHSVEG